MEKWPKISVVTPVLNQVKFLEETIQSVLNQGYPNLEYIIVDGGSTDGSLEIIKKYEDQIACWISEKDEGIYHAVEKGFERSGGEIMAWIGSDDKYHPGALFIVAKVFMNQKNVKWVMGAVTNLDEDGQITAVSYEHKPTFASYLAGGSRPILQQESVFWRRCVWIKVGSRFNSKYKFACEVDLWVRFFEVEKLHIVEGLIGSFRHRKGQTSDLFRGKYLAEKRLILKHGLRRNFWQYPRVYIYKLCGWVAFQTKRVNPTLAKQIFNIPFWILKDSAPTIKLDE